MDQIGLKNIKRRKRKTKQKGNTMAETKWQEIIFDRDPNNPKKVKYANRVSFYNKQGNWKVTDSSKKTICKGSTKDMGMLVSHLVHKYNSNQTYQNINRDNKIKILFQETITLPVVKVAKN